MQIVMTHHVEGKVFQFQPIRDRLIIGMARVITDCAKDVALITATWTHKPKFTIRYPQYRAGTIQASISTSDKRWIWVSEGTPPHAIPKAGRKRMHFRRHYTSKTSPFTIASRGGGRSGPWQHPSKVMHKGIKPRKFFQAIAYRRFPDFKAAVRIALSA